MSFVTFTHTVGNLKGVKRTGWIVAGVPEPESVAEHSYRLAVLCMFLGKKFRKTVELNTEKLIQMALIHDLAEVLVGDMVIERGLEKAALADRTKKSQLEREAFQQIFADIDDGEEYFQLWQEFEANSTVEARLVRQLDKFEMAAQALEYEGKVDPTRLNEFWDNARSNVEDPQLRSLLDELQNSRKINAAS